MDSPYHQQESDHLLAEAPVQRSLLAMGQDDVTLDRAKRFAVTLGLIEQSRITPLFVIFIVLTLLFNTAIVIFIMASKAMRRSSRHVLIISVCLGDILMGLFVLPVLLDLRMREGDEVQDCPTFYAMRLFADYLIPSVTTLAMLMLNVDYLIRLGYSSYAEGSTRTTLLTLLFLTPWVASCVLLIPLFIDTLNRTEVYWWETCNIDMGGYGSRTMLVVSYFPQAFLLLLANLIVSVLYLLTRETYSLDATGERLRAPVDLCFATFLTLILYTPVFIVALLSTDGYKGCLNPEQCGAFEDVITVLVWLLYSKSWLLPFCWLACRDTRTCIRHVFKCC